MAYDVYSLPDCKSVLCHPDVGTCNLHQCGIDLGDHLPGFNDYQDFCREYLDDTENWLTGSLRTA